MATRTSSNSIEFKDPYRLARFWSNPDNQYWRQVVIVSIDCTNGKKVTTSYSMMYSESTKERLDNFVATKARETKAITSL